MIGIFVEVSPLLELTYTGIPNVTVGLAECWLRHRGLEVFFISGSYVLDRGSVERAIRLRTGAVLRCEIDSGGAVIDQTLAAAARCERTAAIFPNVKTIQNAFDLEYQIVHDISFLITPEFHHADTIRYHGYTLFRDLASNTKTICVSEATRSDLLAYCQVPPETVVTVYSGFDRTDLRDLQAAVRSGIAARRVTEPYVVVPGTIEPRKNGALVLEFLRQNPDVLDRYRFIFFGRPGWLTDFHEVASRYGLAAEVRSGRLRWLKYVSDLERQFLFSNACFTLYPSVFEGFGLPVGEAMAAGCPVICSYSSGIPEAAGDAGFYFDPLDWRSLAAAFAAAERARAESPKSLAQACRKQAAKFTWKRFNEQIEALVLDDLGVARAA
jgi:glycosyltransferase involved in cell wall biosynthesis